jgi:hypothetical protein
MFDGINTALYRRLDTLCAMRVRRYAQAPLMRLIRNYAELALGKLLLAGLGVAGEYPSCCA